jgi:TonB family protein
VALKAVITAEGNAEQIEVVRSLDSGLDQKAIDALSQWTFQPGTKDGKAVAVWATVEINFKLL